MPFVDTPFTPEVGAAVHQRWGIAGAAERLHGGEESASYRLGEHVVRIGPSWRTDEELAYSFAIAAAAGRHVPEVTAPCSLPDGGHLVRVGNRPVSVWPYVSGSWADPADEQQRVDAAGLLARLHQVFAAMNPPGARPRREESRVADVPEVNDPELDRWMEDFRRRRTGCHPLHADYYRGNVLVRDRAIVGLIDWDDAFVGPPEQELAWAAWEWGRGLESLDLGPALAFIDRYIAAGGTAERIDVNEFVHLVRARIRMDIMYSNRAGTWGTSGDPDDIAYEASEVHAFRTLRTLTDS